MFSKSKAGIKNWVGKAERIRDRLFRLTWVRFISTVVNKVGTDYVGIMAAGLSYYTFLSLFPLIIGLISILGFLLPSEQIYDTIFTFLSQNIPVSTGIIESNIKSVIALRGPLGLIGVAGLLVGGTGIFSAISLAINRTWDLKPRPLYTGKPREFAMILALGVMILIFLGISTGLSLLGDVAFPNINFALSALSKLISFLFILAIFLLLYRFVPNTVIYWRDIWPGAILGAVLFQLALLGFTIFLNRFANYQMTYGTLASIVVLLVWIYASSFILILCAEINAVYYRLKTTL